MDESTTLGAILDAAFTCFASVAVLVIAWAIVNMVIAHAVVAYWVLGASWESLLRWLA